MKQLSWILCALVALPASADTLGEVRAAVARLSGKPPVSGTFAIEQKVSSAGRFANDRATRLATANVSHDDSGMTISIPQPMLERASQESRSADGDGSARDAIGAIKSLEVLAALNFRDAFLTMTDGARVVEEKQSTFRGRPAYLIVLKLAEERKKERNSIQVGSVKSDDRLRLWIDDDKLPLAAERDTKTTAGFMFFNGKFHAQSTYSFTMTRERLILTRLETHEDGSGMGQKVDRTSVQTLTIQ